MFVISTGVKQRYVELVKVKSEGYIEDYVPGLKWGFTSLPDGFKLTGYLIDDVKLGECVEIKVDRGLIRGGKIISNPVVEITRDGFKTKNTTYTINLNTN